MRMQNQSVLVIGFACAVASKCYFTLLAGGVFLQEEEDEGDDQQDCDRKHAHRSVAGQRRGGRNEESADNRSGLAENIIETVIFVGTILWNDLAVIRARQRLNTALEQAYENRKNPEFRCGTQEERGKQHNADIGDHSVVIMVFAPKCPASLP